MAFSAFKSTSKRGNSSTFTSSASSRTNTIEREITEKSPKKSLPRRSRSVSALSRTTLDVASEFLNKRDNPLFSNNGGSPPDNELNVIGPSKQLLDDSSVGIAKLVDTVSKSSVRNSISGSGSGSAKESRRGRSVLRKADAGNKSSVDRNEIGRRSLSRVDTGRCGRSVSLRPVLRNHSESEVEQEYSSSLNLQDNRNLNMTDGRRNFNMVRNSSELLDGMKTPRTWCGQHPPPELSDTSSELLDGMESPLTWSSQHPPIELSDTSSSCLQVPNLQVGGLMNSFWEAEEKTIKAVSEQMKADCIGVDIATSGIYETVRTEVRRAISDIQNDLQSAIRRNNTTPITSTNVADAPLDPVKPGAVELVLDIRREYAKELEQSHERARKLRADLAVEEHRGIELSRILKELLPEPKANLQKSRPGRKTSIERRKMSKRLEDEAMAYFDECVSLSTFDSSDFSSPEDPPLNVIGVTALVGDHASLPQGNSTALTTYSPSNCLTNKETGIQGYPMHSHENSGLTDVSSKNEAVLNQFSPNGTNTDLGQKFQFSFADEPTKATFELQRDIRNYVRNFEKSVEKDGVGSKTLKSNHYDLGEYNLQIPAENFLFDRVFFKSRIESGGLIICGSFPISVSPFASII